MGMPRPGDRWQVGQVVALKKPHPCGGRSWTIYKLGLDVGLQCRQCGQRIKLMRRQFERAVERIEEVQRPTSKDPRVCVIQQPLCSMPTASLLPTCLIIRTLDVGRHQCVPRVPPLARTFAA